MSDASKISHPVRLDDLIEVIKGVHDEPLDQLTDAVLAGLRDKLWAQREPGALSDAGVITLYRLRLPLGLVARHRNALDAV